MTRLKIWFFSIAVIAILAACAVRFRLYTPPAQGSLAHLSVVDSVGDSLTFEHMIALYEEQANCKGRWFIHGAHKKMMPANEFLKIKADQPLSLSGSYFHEKASSFGGLLGVYESCGVIINFNPASNRYYRVFLSAKSNDCRMVVRVSDDISMRASENVPFTVMRPTKAIDENDSFCRAP